MTQLQRSTRLELWLSTLCLVGFAVLLVRTCVVSVESAAKLHRDAVLATARFERSVRDLASTQRQERVLARELEHGRTVVTSLRERVQDATIRTTIAQAKLEVAQGACRGVGAPPGLLEPVADPVSAGKKLLKLAVCDLAHEMEAQATAERTRSAEALRSEAQSLAGATSSLESTTQARAQLWAEITRLEGESKVPPQLGPWQEWPRLFLDGFLIVLWGRLVWHFFKRTLIYSGAFRDCRLPGVSTTDETEVEIRVLSYGTTRLTRSADGGDFHFATAFHRSMGSALPWLPPAPAGSPIARLLHGRYWLRSFRSAASPGHALSLVAPSRSAPGSTFAVITLAAGQSMFVDMKRLVGFSGGGGHPHTLLGGAARAACWLIGHPLPVVFQGPVEIVVFGQALSTGATPPIVNVERVLAFQASTPFTLMTPGGQNALARVMDVLWSKIDFRSEGDSASLLVEESAVHATSVLQALPHLLKHLALMAALTGWALGVVSRLIT